ncbi:MAG: hypothetical protein WCD35_11665 [Mycobacteriales bacterium]
MSGSADVTRCVGAVETPGAFACYTSPRFDHIGLTRTTVATVPVAVYRPTDQQPYVATSSSGTFTPFEQDEVLALSAALDATNP